MFVHQRNHLLGGFFVFWRHVSVEQIVNIAKRYRAVAQAKPRCAFLGESNHEAAEIGFDDLLLLFIKRVPIALLPRLRKGSRECWCPSALSSAARDCRSG